MSLSCSCVMRAKICKLIFTNLMTQGLNTDSQIFCDCIKSVNLWIPIFIFGYLAACCGVIHYQEKIKQLKLIGFAAFGSFSENHFYIFLLICKSVSKKPVVIFLIINPTPFPLQTLCQWHTVPACNFF